MGQLRPKYAHCCEKTTQPARQRHRTLICYCRTIPLKSFLGGKCDKKVNFAWQHLMSKRIAQFGSKEATATEFSSSSSNNHAYLGKFCCCDLLIGVANFFFSAE